MNVWEKTPLKNTVRCEPITGDKFQDLPVACHELALAFRHMSPHLVRDLLRGEVIVKLGDPRRRIRAAKFDKASDFSVRISEIGVGEFSGFPVESNFILSEFKPR